jgi:hypothetical protein
MAVLPFSILLGGFKWQDRFECGRNASMSLSRLPADMSRLGAFGFIRPQELEMVAQLIRLDAPAHAVA